MPRAPRWLTNALAVVACVLLPLGILSSWVASVVSDTDTYVSTVGPLADDPLVQRAAIVKLNALAVDAIDLDAQKVKLNDLLEKRDTNLLVQMGAMALADRAGQRVEKAVGTVVTRVVESPQFRPAWEAANRSAHEQLVAVLEDKSNSLVDDSGRVSLPLGTVLNTVIGTLVDRGVIDSAQAPQIDTTFTLIQARDLEKVRGYYGLLNALGFWLPVVWLVLVAVVVVLARDRRKALGWLGYGSLLSVGLLGAGLAWGHDYALGHLPDPNDAALADAVLTELLSGLRLALRTALLVTLGVLLVRWVFGPSRPAVAMRGTVTTLREREDLEIVRGVLVAVLAVAFVWWVL